jgi:hypothetical protein
VPANSFIELSIQTACGDILWEDVQTKMTSEAIPAIDVTSEVSVIQLQGTARGCADEILSNHFLQIGMNDHETTLYFDSGVFSLPLVICDESMLVTSYTNDWADHGPTIYWDTALELNLHSTYACAEAMQEYFALRINGDNKIYWTGQSQLTVSQRTHISAQDPLQPDAICNVWISGMGIGNFDDMQLNIQFEDVSLSNEGYSLYCPTSSEGCGFEDFEITHFGNTGEWIRGYFQGTFWVKTFHPLTAGNKKIVGEFQIYRDF